MKRQHLALVQPFKKYAQLGSTKGLERAHQVSPVSQVETKRRRTKQKDCRRFSQVQGYPACLERDEKDGHRRGVGEVLDNLVALGRSHGSL